MSLPRFLLVGFLVLGLGGCGFQSLYGAASHKEVREEKSAIFVLPIEDRIGQQLRNELQDLLTPMGIPRNPAYEMLVRVHISEVGLGVRSTALTTRAKVNVQGSFSLRPIDPDSGRGEVFSGRRVVTSGYNVYQSDYATLEAKQNAETRAIKELAREIEAQVAVYLVQAKQ